MIDINKKYRTRDGREVRIYAVDGNMPLCVHGAFKDHGEWRFCSWQQDGVQFFVEGPFDLIEVKPRIKRTLWVNLFPVTAAAYLNKFDADSFAGFARLSCIKVEIDCEEGEGL